MNEQIINRTIIVIPHYNNLKGLQKSIQSIKHPTGIDILVVDDGSSVSQTPDLVKLKNISDVKSNVKLILSSKNEGITAALNKGLERILEWNRHDFIARLDCGDTSVENRFIQQEKFFDNNLNISLIGSWVKWIDNDSGEVIFQKKLPCEHKNIKKSMSFQCNFIHPSVMYRLSVVKAAGKYPDKYTAAEDYAFFYKIVQKFESANIPAFLTSVDFSKDGISAKNRNVQNKSKIRIILNYGRNDLFKLFGIVYNIALSLIPFEIGLSIKKRIFQPR